MLYLFSSPQLAHPPRLQQLQRREVALDTNQVSLPFSINGTQAMILTPSGLGNAAGYRMLQVNATDWLRINPDANSTVSPSITFTNGTAAYGPWSFGGTGGVTIGAWCVKTNANCPTTGQLYVTNAVSIGTTTTNYSLDATGPTGSVGATTMYVARTISVGTPTAGGSVDATGGSVIAAAYYHNSDVHLKTDIHPIGHALDKLLAIQGVQFNWKQDGRADMGVVAQNVAEVFPDIVSKNKDGMMSVEYDSLVGPMIESIRELKSENDDLRNQIASLNEIKTQVNEIRSSLKDLKAENQQLKSIRAESPLVKAPSSFIDH